MFRNRWITVTGLLFAFGLIGVPSAPAQISPVDEARAQALWQEARAAPVAQPAAARRVAKLFVRSAALREDPLADEALESLWNAANLYYWGERPRRALRLLEQVAEMANRRGEVLFAGRAHYCMGHVAAELGDASKVSDCQNWIRELARSSHLTPNQARELTLSAEGMTPARAEAGN